MNKLKLVTMAMLSVAAVSWADTFIDSRTFVDQSIFTYDITNGMSVGSALGVKPYSVKVCSHTDVDPTVNCAMSTSTTGYTRTFRWQKMNPRTKNYGDYAGEKFEDGNYRLVVDYRYLRSFTDYARNCDLFLNDPMYSDVASVNDVDFKLIDIIDSLRLEDNSWAEASKINAVQNSCYASLYRRSYASEPMTIGSAGSLALKPVCLDIKTVDGKADTTVVEGCGVEFAQGYEYKYDEIYKGDNIGLRLNSTNPEYSSRFVKAVDSTYLDGKFVGDQVLTPDDNYYPNEKTWSYKKPAAGDDTITIFMVKGSGHKVSYNLTMSGIAEDVKIEDVGSVEGESYIHKDEAAFFVELKDGYSMKTIKAQYKPAASGPVKDANLTCEAGLSKFHGKQGYLCRIYDSYIDNDVTVSIVFANASDAVALKLKKSDHVSSYTVSKGDYTYAYDGAEKTYNTRITGAMIMIEADAEDGFIVSKGEFCYIYSDVDYCDNLEIDSTKGNTFYLHAQVPVLSKIENDKGVTVELFTKAVSAVSLDYTGRINYFYIYDEASYDDEQGEYDVCFLVYKGEKVSDPNCKFVEGASIGFYVELQPGYNLKSVKCENGDDNLGCSTSKGFTMPAAAVSINAVVEAVNYNLTKVIGGTYGGTDGYSFYSDKECTNAITSAHALDTVYIKADDPDKVVSFVSAAGATGYVGDGVFTKIMKASDWKVEATVANKYAVDIQVDGGYDAVLGKEVAYSMTSKGAYVGDDFSSQNLQIAIVSKSALETNENKSGYTLDSVYCDYQTQGTMKKVDLVTENSDVTKAIKMPGYDVTCKVYSSPKSYKLEWSVADENGVLKTPKVGDKAYDKDENPAKTDAEVSFDVSAFDGYKIDFVSVYVEEEQAISADEKVVVKIPVDVTGIAGKNDVYTYKFTMPAQDVKIEAAFKEIEKFTITYKFDKEEVTEELEEGAMPTAPAKFTCPAKTAEFTYSCAWDKDFAKVTEAATYTYKATATKNKYTVAVKVNDSKMGSVKGAGEYEYGTEVELVATAAEGYKFSNWKDDAKAAATRKVTVKEAVELTANFEKLPESSSSSTKTEAIFAAAQAPKFSLSVAGRSVQIAGARIGSAYAILDMQGRVMTTGSVESANFSVALPRSGSYMVRVGSQAQRVNVR